jgi:hypothetical protein
VHSEVKIAPYQLHSHIFILNMFLEGDTQGIVHKIPGLKIIITGKTKTNRHEYNTKKMSFNAGNTNK